MNLSQVAELPTAGSNLESLIYSQVGSFVTKNRNIKNSINVSIFDNNPIKSIFALSQIKNILPSNIRQLVYNSLVGLILNNGNVTWGGVKNSKVQKIRSLQKRQ